MRRVALAAGILAPANGGIASVARMTRSAAALCGHRVKAVSYLDSAETALGDGTSTASASKIRFAALVHRAALQSDLLIFDSAGIARSRPRVRFLRRPYAVWMHGIEAWEAARPHTIAAYREAALVLVNSHFTLRRYEDLHGSLPNACVCWLATESDAPEAEPPAFEGPPAVLILSRIDAGEGYKGHDELISVWPRVTASVPQARLVIAGGGSGLANIRARALASPAAASIDVLGFVPENNILQLWRRAHLFAMPSRGEGFGLVYAEAMRYGLPVIASRHDAGQEVNADGISGYNVGLDSGDELAARLIELTGDRDKARAMGAAGRERWQQNFRFSSFAHRLSTILRERGLSGAA